MGMLKRYRVKLYIKLADYFFDKAEDLEWGDR